MLCYIYIYIYIYAECCLCTGYFGYNNSVYSNHIHRSILLWDILFCVRLLISVLVLMTSKKYDINSWKIFLQQQISTPFFFSDFRLYHRVILIYENRNDQNTHFKPDAFFRGSCWGQHCKCVIKYTFHIWYMCVCVYIYTHMCVCVYIHTHTHTHTHTHI